MGAANLTRAWGDNRFQQDGSAQGGVKQSESYTLERQPNSPDTWQGWYLLTQEGPSDGNSDVVPKVEITFEMQMRLEEERDA